MAKLNGTKTRKASGAPKSRPATKTEAIIRLLKRPSGATMAQLQKATGWQSHSVRGFVSGTIKKQMGFIVSSQISGKGERNYRIVEKADA